MEQNRYGGARPPLVFEEKARYEEEGLAVIVKAAQAGRYTRWSVTIGKIRDDGSVSNFIPIQVSVVEGKVRTNEDVIHNLIRMADEYIQTEEGANLDARVEKDLAKNEYGKPKTRVTGKTAKKKARHSESRLPAED